MTNWQPIETAPKDGWETGERIDIWAKKWRADTDEFTYKRFPDCFMRGGKIAGVEGWYPTHWMPPPEPPHE